VARSARRPPAKDPVAELVELARDLDLTTAASGLEDLLERAVKEGLSFTQFAHALLAGEATARTERRLERSLRRSRLGVVEGIEGFDFGARPKLDERVVRELLNCEYVRNRRNVICIGRPGLGKTRIAKAIVHAACLAGHSTLTTTATEMVEHLHASHADGTFRRALWRYVKPEVLLCDEFAYQAFDEQATSYVFRVISARHKQGATVITANTGFSKWKAFFPSEAHAVAAVDRLVDDATILRFTGRSFRQPREVTGEKLDDE
jgi:DNA replication protein DnaC